MLKHIHCTLSHRDVYFLQITNVYFVTNDWFIFQIHWHSPLYKWKDLTKKRKKLCRMIIFRWPWSIQNKMYELWTERIDESETLNRKSKYSRSLSVLPFPINLSTPFMSKEQYTHLYHQLNPTYIFIQKKSPWIWVWQIRKFLDLIKRKRNILPKTLTIFEQSFFNDLICENLNIYTTFCTFKTTTKAQCIFLIHTYTF